MFESLGDGLLVLNTSALIVEANRAALTLLGLAQKREIFGPISTGLAARVIRTDGAPFGREDLGLFQTLREGGIGARRVRPAARATAGRAGSRPSPARSATSTA